MKRFILVGAGLISVWASTRANQAGDDAVAAMRDTLVYKDGDRVLGKFLERSDNVLVFKSDRFGELRVPNSEAVVIPAEKTVSTTATAGTVGEKAVAPTRTGQTAEGDQQERVSVWERFSPFMLTAKVRRFFGPYHGKFGFTAESVSDTTDRDNVGVDTRLQRKWERDEVQFNGRYTYSETAGLATTDLVKSDAFWRHDFPHKKHFFNYRPTFEWNRAYLRSGVPADYVLVQQEVGGGVNLLATPAYKLRAGLSENIFTNWVIPENNHVTTAVESGFFEVEAKLPWRVTVLDRTVYYYSLTTGKDGFENNFELDKKFTETLSLGLRYEVRYNNPDVRSANYNLLRLVFGFDF